MATPFHLKIHFRGKCLLEKKCHLIDSMLTAILQCISSFFVCGNKDETTDNKVRVTERHGVKTNKQTLLLGLELEGDRIIPKSVT